MIQSYFKIKFNKSIPFKFLSSFILSFILVACDSDSEKQPELAPQLQFEFAEQYLNGLIVNRVLANDGEVLLATDKGVYKSVGQTDWELISTDEWEVVDIVKIDIFHFIVSVIYRGDNLLVETLDSGLTWNQFRSKFGPELNTRSEGINRLYWDENTQTLFATGVDVLARSYDKGNTWELISGIWNSLGRGMRAISYSHESNIAFYGGQGALENPILRKVDLTNMVEESYDLTNLLPLPSTIREIQFDTQNENTVYVSGEGGIVFSANLGETWAPLLTNDNYRFYFDLVKDTRYAGHFYTAGWDKKFDTPQPLIVEITQDNGMSWREFVHPDLNIFGGVRSMDVVYENDRTTLYLGLYKGGVIKAYLK